MPLYEYVCDSCGEIFDKMSSIADRNKPTEEPCAKCGEMKVRQNIGPTPLADPVRLGRIKAPEGFRDVLRNVKKNHRGTQFTVD